MGLNVTQLKFFASMIQNEIGITYAPETYFQLEKRLTEVTKSLGLANEEALYAMAQNGMASTAKQLLLDVSTNNETSFFRDPKAFKALEEQIIPAIIGLHPGLSVIRIWCAATSFGQEPYSLAMLLAEMALKKPGLPRFEIVATDISETALSRAKEGRYSQLEVQRGLPAPLMVKYFTKGADDYWSIRRELRISVQFKRQNLLEAFATLGDFELVLCRNVLIYQTDAKKREILVNIARRITPRGFLLLGAAESLLNLSTEFDQVCKDGAVYFQKK